MRHTTFKRAGLALLVCGVALFVATSVSNRRGVWLPLVGDLPLVANETATFEFTPLHEGFYELQIEADDTVGDEALRRFVIATEQLSELDVAWTVADGGGNDIAAGGSRDYVYVEQGPPSRLGKLRRILLRIPYCQNVRQWRTLGLAGSSTSARGVGRFAAVAGARYTIRVTPAADYPALAAGNVKLVVRPDRRRWQTHFTSTRATGYAALAACGVGPGLFVLSWLMTLRGSGSASDRRG